MVEERQAGGETRPHNSETFISDGKAVIQPQRLGAILKPLQWAF
jgi:hypothetical protein